MRGLIRYTAKVDGTPQQGPFDMYNPFSDSVYPFLDTVDAGSETEIYLPAYFFIKPLDPVSKKSASRSTSGVMQVRWFSRSDRWSITFTDIVEDRDTWNPYAVFNAMNDAADRGAILTWYPNIDDYPDEYLSCMVEKMIKPTRIRKMPVWEFTYELTILPDVQMPSTVPVFV